MKNIKIQRKIVKPDSKRNINRVKNISDADYEMIKEGYMKATVETKRS